MARVITVFETKNSNKNYTGKVISDPKYNEKKTALRFRMADNLLGIIDAVIFGETKDGNVMPIDPKEVANIVKGANLKYDFKYDINPSEKDGKKYLNEHIVLQAWTGNDVPTTEISGTVFFDKDAQGPRINQVGDRKAFSFQLCRGRGKDGEGNYKPSHFIDVTFFGNELPACVTSGAKVTIMGRLKSNPRTVEVTQPDGTVKEVTYANRQIEAWKIEDNTPVEVDIDAVRAAGLATPRASAPSAGTPAAPAGEPMPVYEPAIIDDGDMPY